MGQTLSPFSKELTGLDQTSSASEGHDYASIALWYAHKEDDYQFCNALIRSMLDAKHLTEVDVEEIFGRSEFETQPDEWVDHGTAYRPGSRLQARFTRMATSDKSFAQYLSERGIKQDLSNIVSGDVRAADIRKIASILTVREAFRVSDAKIMRKRIRKVRSRKNPTLYAGTKSLFAISEGNPRWLKGIVGRLLTDVPSVSAGKQASEILEASHRFRALLRTIPCPPIVGRQPTRGLLSVMDSIGDFFSAGSCWRISRLSLLAAFS